LRWAAGEPGDVAGSRNSSCTDGVPARQHPRNEKRGLVFASLGKGRDFPPHGKRGDDRPGGHRHDEVDQDGGRARALARRRTPQIARAGPAQNELYRRERENRASLRDDEEGDRFVDAEERQDELEGREHSRRRRHETPQERQRDDCDREERSEREVQRPLVGLAARRDQVVAEGDDEDGKPLTQSGAEASWKRRTMPSAAAPSRKLNGAPWRRVYSDSRRPRAQSRSRPKERRPIRR